MRCKCKNCKWWTGPKLRTCIAIPAGDDEVIMEYPYIKAEEPSSYKTEARLITPPDFGCVLFEKQEEAK